MSEPLDATITYPGGLRARWRSGGSGSGPSVFALTEAAGELRDFGTLVSPDPDALCRAELHLEGPRGAWTARFASLIHDEPRAIHWDTAALLVVAYGFTTYGIDVASGDRRWDHRSASPILALLGSSRLAHVLVQSEIETFAIEEDGTVAWRVAHSDVVTAAEMVGGRLVLTGFDGQVRAPRPVDRPDGRLSRRVETRWTTPRSSLDSVDGVP